MGPLHSLLGQMAQVGGEGVPSTGGSGLLGQFGMGGTANNFLRGFTQGYAGPAGLQTFQPAGLNATTFGQLFGQRLMGGGGNQGGGEMDANQMARLLMMLNQRGQ